MLDKPSREQFFSRRAKKARKHEQKRRENAERKRREYGQLQMSWNAGNLPPGVYSENSKENEDAS